MIFKFIVILSCLCPIGLTCIRDSVEVKIWQPLPPVVMDKDGKAMTGQADCESKMDMEECKILGCLPETEDVTNSSAGKCSDYKCFRGFCLTTKQRDDWIKDDNRDSKAGDVSNQEEDDIREQHPEAMEGIIGEAQTEGFTTENSDEGSSKLFAVLNPIPVTEFASAFRGNLSTDQPGDERLNNLNDSFDETELGGTAAAVGVEAQNSVPNSTVEAPKEPAIKNGTLEETDLAEPKADGESPNRLLAFNDSPTTENLLDSELTTTKPNNMKRNESGQEEPKLNGATPSPKNENPQPNEVFAAEPASTTENKLGGSEIQAITQPDGGSELQEATSESDSNLDWNPVTTMGDDDGLTGGRKEGLESVQFQSRFLKKDSQEKDGQISNEDLSGGKSFPLVMLTKQNGESVPAKTGETENQKFRPVSVLPRSKNANISRLSSVGGINSTASSPGENNSTLERLSPNSGNKRVQVSGGRIAADNVPDNQSEDFPDLGMNRREIDMAEDVPDIPAGSESPSSDPSHPEIGLVLPNGKADDSGPNVIEAQLASRSLSVRHPSESLPVVKAVPDLGNPFLNTPGREKDLELGDLVDIDDFKLREI